MKTSQHGWSGDHSYLSGGDQIGWVRVDPHKNDEEGKPVPHDHWHLDEIQSDFQNPNKIKQRLHYSTDEDINEMLGKLSHGHDDPQHLLHSVANAMGRKLGVKSTSMDMPEDQAKKNHLEGYRDEFPLTQRNMGRVPEHRTTDGWERMTGDHIRNGGIPEEHKDAIWEKHGQKLVDEHMADDPDFKSAADKLGPEGIRKFAEHANRNTHGKLFDGGNSAESEDWGIENPDLDNLNSEEKDALSSFLLKHSDNVRHHAGEHLGIGTRPDENVPYNPATDTYTQRQAEAAQEEEEKKPKKALPTHHINTYSKRPKKLGFKEANKGEILGYLPNDGDDGDPEPEKIQYAKLHKRLKELNQYIADLKKNK